jgi:ketosteroid isomerase-like protein
MKRIVLAILGLCALTACTEQDSNSDRTNQDEFASFLERLEVAQEAFINGDPTDWKANTAQTADATVFGQFGGFEKGWAEVGPRYDWAASQFRESGATKSIELLSLGVNASLAFSVAIERQQIRIAGQREPTELALRVTQVYRREGSGWKLLHRHADPLVERKAPGS